MRLRFLCNGTAALVLALAGFPASHGVIISIARPTAKHSSPAAHFIITVSSLPSASYCP